MYLPCYGQHSSGGRDRHRLSHPVHHRPPPKPLCLSVAMEHISLFCTSRGHRTACDLPPTLAPTQRHCLFAIARMALPPAAVLPTVWGLPACMLVQSNPTMTTPKHSYRVRRKLEVFYTGGPVRLSRDGRLLACACADEAKLVDPLSGAVLQTLPGVRLGSRPCMLRRFGEPVEGAGPSGPCMT